MLHAQKQGRLFNSQSKGGKTRGKAGIKSDAIYESMLNKTYGYWKVIYILPFEKTEGYHRKGVCLCTSCNNYAKLMTLEPVRNGKTKWCTGCSLRKNTKNVTKKKKKQKVIQLTKQNEYIATYDSVSDAQLSIGVKIGDANIYRVCNGKRKSAHGYIWKFKD
jgi:hypothetical protein